MSEIEKYYNGEIHVDFDEDKPLLTKEEAEEYYNKLWLDNKELIQENIARLDKKRFALEMELIDKDKKINKLKSIIKEVREYITSQKLHKFQDTTGGLTYEERKLLAILDKENK